MTTIDRMDFNEPISPSLERRVLQGLVGICSSYLEQVRATLIYMTFHAYALTLICVHLKKTI